MKKTFLVGALVALAMTFTSCMDGLLADPVPFTITYKDSAQWAAPTLEVSDTYDFIEIELHGNSLFLGDGWLFSNLCHPRHIRGRGPFMGGTA